MMSEYIFDTWKPNLYLIMLSLGLFAFLIVSLNILYSVILTIAIIFFGWSFSFSKRLKEKKE